MPTEPTEPPAPPPPANLTALFAAAQDASDDATAAGEAATAAVASAEKNGMTLTTAEVGGDTMKAMMSAQAILDARDAAAKAVMDAEAALAAAEKAQMDAMAVAADHPQKAALTAAVDAAIKAAEGAIEDATAVRDGRALDDEVFKVVGANGKGTPRSIADKVGMDIVDSLSPGTTFGRTRGAHLTEAFTDLNTSSTAAQRSVMDDHQGMTWGEIVGETNVMMMRLGAANAAIPVASIAGMTASSVNPDESDLSATGGTNGVYDDAFATDATDINYMGILGTVYCLGGDDGCSIKDGKLAGSWYFSPTSPMAYYVRNPDRDTSVANPYVLETSVASYASYGYWVAGDAADPPVWTVGTGAWASGGGTTADTHYTVGASDDLAASASYSGEAIGISVHKTPKDGGGNHVDSGMFTADVMLEATFGASPEVSGIINNFQGDAVGSGWSVTLDGTDFAATAGDALASGNDGTWTAQAYGHASVANPARPAGIYGGFTAHFLDGHAAGAYATRIVQE